MKHFKLLKTTKISFIGQFSSLVLLAGKMFKEAPLVLLGDIFRLFILNVDERSTV